MSDMRLRDNSTPSLGGTQSPYTRNGSDLNAKDYQNRSYVRPAAPPPLDMRTPTTGTSVPLTPSYTYPSGNTTYTTPSMTRYTPSPPPSGMSRPMRQPEYSYKRMDQPSAIPIQPTQPGQTYPLSNPDTFRPRYSQYSGSSQAVPSPYQQPQQAIPIQSNQRISYARTQGNIVSPSSSSIQNSQGYNINTPVYQGQQQQAQPYPSFPSPSSIQGTRSFSQTPSRQAGSGFPRPVDTRTALSEVWNRLESNRDMQRSLKNMLSECVEMLVSVARSLAFAVEQGSVDWQEVSVVHRRGLDAWRQEVSRRFPVESPFVIREFVGCDLEFLGDLVQGFKKRSDSQSRNQKNERTIHLERSSSNQQSAFVEIDSGLQTPSR